MVFFNLHVAFELFYFLSLLQDEYAQKTGLVSKALTLLDEQKKEVDPVFTWILPTFSSCCHIIRSLIFLDYIHWSGVIFFPLQFYCQFLMHIHLHVVRQLFFSRNYA